MSKLARNIVAAFVWYAVGAVGLWQTASEAGVSRAVWAGAVMCAVFNATVHLIVGRAA